MRIEYEIKGTIELPEGSVMTPGVMNQVTLPNGTIISVYPTIEWINNQEYTLLTVQDCKNLGIEFEEFDRYVDEYTDTVESSSLVVDTQTENTKAFLSPEEFIKAVRKQAALKPAYTPELMVNTFSFSQEMDANVIMGHVNYDEDYPMTDLADRYTKMVDLIDDLKKKAYTPLILNIIEKKDRQGLTFTYTTPTNRKMTSEYIGDPGTPLIPDDFLRDLKHIPLRGL